MFLVRPHAIIVMCDPRERGETRFATNRRIIRSYVVVSGVSGIRFNASAANGSALCTLYVGYANGIASAAPGETKNVFVRTRDYRALVRFFVRPFEIEQFGLKSRENIEKTLCCSTTL